MLKTDNEKLRELNFQIYKLRTELASIRSEQILIENQRDILLSEGSGNDLEEMGTLKLQMATIRQKYSQKLIQFFSKIGERNNIRLCQEELEHPLMNTYSRN